MDILTVDLTAVTSLVVVLFTVYYLWYFTKLWRCGLSGPIPMPVVGNLFWQLKYTDFVLANSADPGEILHYAAFHPGLLRLSKYPFRSFRSTKGFNVMDAFWEKKYGKIYGVYSGHNLNVMVTDTDFLKNVMVKDFSSYINRRARLAGVLKQFLFFARGSEWRRTRNIMTPAFSSGKLKLMLSEINICAEILADKFCDASDTGRVVAVKDYFSSFTCDVIARTAFGLDVSSQTNSDDQFAHHLELLLKSPKSYIGRLPFILAAIFPSFAMFFPILGITTISKVASDFFTTISYDIIADRKKHPGSHPDFMQLLIDARYDENLNTSGDEKNISFDQSKRCLSESEIAANVIGFFAAGYETTASLLNYTAYVLAMNPHIDQKLYEEIKRVVEEGIFVSIISSTLDRVLWKLLSSIDQREGGKVMIQRHYTATADPTYENLGQLKYMDQVINETLRMYPPISRLNRELNKDVHYNGMMLPKLSAVIVPVYQMHHDPDNFPDPETFDPERFASGENQPYIQSAAFQPFGQGPRHCIGKRLALMEAKMALVHILRRVRFTTCKETQIPLEVKQIQSLLRPTKPIKLLVEGRR